MAHEFRVITSPALPHRQLRLTVEGMTKAFYGRPAIESVSFTVSAHEFVAVLGPSGAGKTTLFRCVAGLLAPDRGTSRIGHDDITALRGNARRRVAVVFQQFNLVSRLTALDNVLAGRLGYVPAWRGWLRRFGRVAGTCGSALRPSFGWPTAARRDCSRARPGARSYTRRRARGEPRPQCEYRRARVAAKYCSVGWRGRPVQPPPSAICTSLRRSGGRSVARPGRVRRADRPLRSRRVRAALRPARHRHYAGLSRLIQDICKGPIIPPSAQRELQPRQRRRRQER